MKDSYIKDEGGVGGWVCEEVLYDIRKENMNLLKLIGRFLEERNLFLELFIV